MKQSLLVEFKNSSRKFFCLVGLIVFVTSLFYSPMGLASSKVSYKKSIQNVRDTETWEQFQVEMEILRKKDRNRGLGYILSGIFVTGAGLVLSRDQEDQATKFVYGLSSAAGVAATAYGVSLVTFGNEYNSFYESLRKASLTPQQRDDLVRLYMAEEKFRRESNRRIEAVAHLVAGAINVYAASRENQRDAKTFFSVLAGINLALGVSLFF